MPLLSASEVARRKRVARNTVVAAIEAGLLRAEQVGGTWAVEEAAADAWVPRKRGKPKRKV